MSAGSDHSFRLSCWNISTTPHYSSVKFSQVADHLKPDAQDILCLQELGNPQNIDEAIQPFLHTQGLQQSWNAVVTRLAIEENINLAPPAACADVESEHVQMIRLKVHDRSLVIYNCHLPIVNAGFAQRIPMLQMVLDHASSHNLPTVICGDLNSTLPAEGWRRLLVRLVHRIPKRRLFYQGRIVSGDERDLVVEMLNGAGFTETFPVSQPTWAFPRTSWEPLSLKLDWIATRGLRCIQHSFDQYVTDHRRLHATLAFTHDRAGSS